MSDSGPILLIVDDDHDIRETLTDVLTDEGYRVAQAADGLDALEYLRSNAAPFLILLDWMMPRCDGAQFRAAQLADPELAAIPVVLLTADARMDEKQQAIDADGALAKPVRLDRLLDVVAAFYPARAPQPV